MKEIKLILFYFIVNKIIDFFVFFYCSKQVIFIIFINLFIRFFFAFKSRDLSPYMAVASFCLLRELVFDCNLQVGFLWPEYSKLFQTSSFIPQAGILLHGRQQ